MTRNGILAIALAAFCALGGATAEAADLKKGKKVFNKCKACHALEAGKKKVGPSLHGVFGRKAGTVDGFKYSKAMVDSGIVWDDATITEYLKRPKKYIPGNKMAFAGLKKQDDIDNLLAYLRENTN
ncbi:MAG: cytochrome c family protein [Kiloniellales bacterium]|nr:cytochrome c family protein [Kiloniellales bacterium]